MKRFKSILVICDEDIAVENTIQRARSLAVANDASITLMYIVDVEPGRFARLFAAMPDTHAHELEDQVFDFHQKRLERLADPLLAKGLRVQTVVEQGIAFLQIIRCVASGGHDLVIKAAQRRTGRLFFGGTDMHLMRKCPCPVWIMKPEAAQRSRRVLAAIDPDPDDPVRNSLCHTVMELATSLARQDDADLDVINVWRLPEESALRHGRIKMPENEVKAIVNLEERQSALRLNTLMTAFPDEDGRRQVLHVKGVPGQVIPEHARATSIDTIVMGTLGRIGIAGFFIGNTAETILNSVECSVLTVKPPGFLSPVETDESNMPGDC